MNHKNLQAWDHWFTTPTGKRYTMEAAPVGRRTIFTADPENIKAILATQFTDYGKGEPFHREWKDFLGDSIFTTDLDQWHDSRQLIRPQFVKDRVSDLEVFEQHVQVLMQKMVEGGRKWDGSQGGEIDVSDLFFRYTLDAATHFLLGRSVGSLELPEQEFAEAFAEVQRVQNIIARAGYGSISIFFMVLKIANQFQAVESLRTPQVLLPRHQNHQRVRCSLHRGNPPLLARGTSYQDQVRGRLYLPACSCIVHSRKDSPP